MRDRFSVAVTLFMVLFSFRGDAQEVPMTQGITFGFALTDSTHQNVGYVENLSFYRVLDDLDLKEVQTDAQLVSGSGQSVANCAVVVGPPSSNALNFFLQLPWGEVARLVSGSIESYTARVVIEYEMLNEQGTRVTQSREWTFGNPDDYQRRWDVVMPEHLSEIKWGTVTVKLLLKVKLHDGSNVQSTYNLLCDMPGVAAALLPKEWKARLTN